jgi:hypothetical protein
MIDIRYHIGPSGEPHIYDHGVTKDEVEDVLRDPLEQTPGRRTSVVAVGLTRAGRYLKVIYSPDEDGDGIFVITAFDLPPKQVRALYRRLRRRRRR